MPAAVRVLAVPHLLSLDAPVVAVLWAHLFASTLELGKLVPGVYLMLFCSVWCIYLCDRLLDTAPWQAAFSDTARHCFYRRHWRLMALLALLPAGAVFWLAAGDVVGGAFAVPSGIVGGGLLLSALVAVYFGVRLATNRYMDAFATALLGFAALAALLIAGAPEMTVSAFVVLFLVILAAGLLRRTTTPLACPKELLCGTLFALGTVMPVYWHVSGSLIPFASDVFGLPVEMFFDGRTRLNADTWLFAGLCILNCVGISIWEKVADGGGRDVSAIAQYAPRVEQLFPILAVALALLAAGQLWSSHSPATWATTWATTAWQPKVTVLLSSLSLLAIHRRRRQLHPLNARLLADAALLWPLPLLAIKSLVHS